LSAAGIIFLVTGIIGIFLPILPTTPFVLLAVACFARSSDKLHQKLVNHRHFGPMISDWQQHRCIPKKIKYRASCFIILSFSLSIYTLDSSYLKIMLLVMMCCLLLFIWRTNGEKSVRKI
jgi:uncharacterized membrane protein YbaN (DUF454 family)